MDRETGGWRRHDGDVDEGERGGDCDREGEGEGEDEDVGG